jgi:hypothetical protein
MQPMRRLCQGVEGASFSFFSWVEMLSMERGVFVVLTKFFNMFSIVLQHVLEIPNVFLNIFPVLLT